MALLRVHQTYMFSSSAFTSSKGINSLHYYLLSAKTRVVYSQVFRTLKDQADSIDVLLVPNLFTSDFEGGLIASIMLEFSNANFHGC